MLQVKENPREEFNRLYKKLEAMSLGLEMQTRAGDCLSKHFHKYRNNMINLMLRLYELLEELNQHFKSKKQIEKIEQKGTYINFFIN
mgnify:CR=1 FL=1